MPKLTAPRIATSTFFLCLPFLSFAQVFWSENFDNGCTLNCLATSYTGTNGAWTQTITGSEPFEPNAWYVSCAENGHTEGTCGTGCEPPSATSTGATLHVSANPSTYGDVGAAYNAFWLTSRRIESPAINCTGRSAITISFDYIEAGDGALDDASLWYYDGSTWSILSNTPKTNNTGCGGQGRWTRHSITLPSSADNNPNVRIGFLWVNNDDNIGTDPSFAVDNITLSGSSALPVDLLHFRATPQGNKVQLNWSTATEINAHYFTIERSSDGRRFQTLDTAFAKGNSNVMTAYQWHDRWPLQGQNYYRLALHDIDGKTRHFNVELVSMASHAKTIVAYPNPATDHVTIESIAPIQRIRLLNQQGMMVKDMPAGGKRSVTLELHSLPAGIYMVRVTNGKGIEIIKLVRGN
ncbi:MAG TPA: T9SS type A sorting domain-containing protein [Chitinophagaceae bacterium]|nr:T9SS type A sorting domain-containing protein [Chitinophagaceae bacterium]